MQAVLALSLISMIVSRFCVASGSGPKRSISLGGKCLDLLLVLQLVDAAIQTHAQIEIEDIFLGNHDRRIDADLRREILRARGLGEPAGLGLHDRLFQHRLVEFEPDFLDMPRLLVAEQVARAANVEIVAGKLEARAQRIEVGKDVQRFSPPSR
jgi:hypothetical protein